MNTLHALIALAATLSVPAPVGATSVWLDPQFTDLETGSILRAMSEWNVALSGHAMFTVCTDEKTWCDVVVEREPERPVWGDTKEVLTLAWVDSIGGRFMYVMADRIASRGEDFRAVIAHEFGHVLGLSHSDMRGTLMSMPTDRQAKCVDSDTLFRLASIRGWDAHNLRPECP